LIRRHADIATRKTTLAESLQRAAGTSPVSEPSEATDAEEAAGQRYIAPARRGKKAVSGHFDPAVKPVLSTIRSMGPCDARRTCCRLSTVALRRDSVV